jgi:hypothetical protein
MPDEPWCGSFDDHHCGGAHCARRSSSQVEDEDLYSSSGSDSSENALP